MRRRRRSKTPDISIGPLGAEQRSRQGGKRAAARAHRVRDRLEKDLDDVDLEVLRARAEVGAQHARHGGRWRPAVAPDVLSCLLLALGLLQNPALVHHYLVARDEHRCRARGSTHGNPGGGRGARSDREDALASKQLEVSCCHCCPPDLLDDGLCLGPCEHAYQLGGVRVT